MNDLLKEMTGNIVDHPEDILVEEEADETGLITLKLRVNPEDMGKIIGKEGKTINAIRTLMRVAAMKQGKRLRVELLEPATGEPQTPEESPSA